MPNAMHFPHPADTPRGLEHPFGLRSRASRSFDYCVQMPLTFAPHNGAASAFPLLRVSRWYFGQGVLARPRASVTKANTVAPEAAYKVPSQAMVGGAVNVATAPTVNDQSVENGGVAVWFTALSTPPPSA